MFHIFKFEKFLALHFHEAFLLFSALKNDELDAGSKNDENHLSRGERSLLMGKFSRLLFRQG
jgi:hypothetical protein